jgi:hypothetical protein
MSSSMCTALWPFLCVTFYSCTHSTGCSSCNHAAGCPAACRTRLTAWGSQGTATQTLAPAGC